MALNAWYPFFVKKYNPEIRKQDVKEVNLMEEDKKTREEIEKLKAEIPKWTSRRKELEKVIQQARMARSMQAGGNQ